jgi:hypothetical protein
MKIVNPTTLQQELIDTIELSEFETKEIFYIGSIGKVFFIKAYTPYRERRVIILFNILNNTVKIYGESGKFIEVSYQKSEDVIYKINKQRNNIKQIFIKEPPKKKIEKTKKKKKTKKRKFNTSLNTNTSNTEQKKAVIHKIYSKVSEHKKPLSIDPIDSFLNMTANDIFDETTSNYNTINNITFIKPKIKRKSIIDIPKKETIKTVNIIIEKKQKVKSVRPRLKKEIIKVLNLLTNKNTFDIFMIELEMAKIPFEIQEYLSQFEDDTRVADIHNNILKKDIFIDEILFDIANKNVA